MVARKNADCCLTHAETKRIAGLAMIMVAAGLSSGPPLSRRSDSPYSGSAFGPQDCRDRHSKREI